MDFLKGRSEERLFGLFRVARKTNEFENCAYETISIFEAEDGDGKVVFKENTTINLVLVREIGVLFEKVFETNRQRSVWTRI